ncbi:ATP-dependent DNA ligase [Arthrobacter sp. ISL-85]|uniref:ATP-dependent DNA ligase n=1 Tax=Arthrobacter sp. ISL-85 TaxID=2819115 RepID=UPI001BE9DAFC|nr:ATP-dependent DNA ligase [Arthrobacter sp. ISL-85]MBT2565089.1 ATP-dependent DNA ligase [Arthrobacter sp. ISL-85]
MAESLPPALQPPVAVALAKLVKTFPGPNALPGGLTAEPKWDGYRTTAYIQADQVTLWSRQGKELTKILPDLAAALAAQVPPGVVLDGEAIIWNKNRLDFEALQQRMVTSRAALPAVVKKLPASFVAFDVLAVAGQDTRGVQFTGRRQLLEELARDWAAPLTLSPTTRDMELAKTWLQDLPATGIEGLVFKGAAQPYEATRAWLKLKHKDVLDVVCAAVIGPVTQPQAIIAGLPIEGALKIIGRSTVLSTKIGRELSQHLRPAGPGHPWPEEISESSLNRFSKAKGPVRLTLVEPVVVEVSADVAWSGMSFRHPVSYRRARPELDPSGVRVPPELDNRRR